MIASHFAAISHNKLKSSCNFLHPLEVPLIPYIVNLFFIYFSLKCKNKNIDTKVNEISRAANIVPKANHEQQTPTTPHPPLSTQAALQYHNAMPPKKRKQSPSKSSSKKTKASPQKYRPPALLKDGKVYYPTIEIASRGARNTAKPQSSSTAKVGETKKTKQRTVKKQVIHKHPHSVIYPSRPWMLLPPGVGMPNPASGPFPVPNVAMPAGVVGASNASLCLCTKYVNNP